MNLKDKNITIKQEIEVAEIFTNFETKNQYKIYDSKNTAIGAAAEESGTASRLFLKSHRPLKLHIADMDGKDIALLTRKFFWFLTDYNILDANNQKIGRIKQRFHFVKKDFEVYDAQDNLIFKCIAKMPHIWTFKVFSQGSQNQEIAIITKKWTGMGKETFTDADIIKVDFGSVVDETQKLLLLATALAFDLTFFEKGG